MHDPGARLFASLQQVLPQHLLSRLVHRLARSRSPALKDLLIGSFVRHFQPSMTEAVEPDPARYASFNEFFTRALKPGARPIVSDPRTVASPVDGTVSQIGHADELRMIQAKGQYYRLDTLLGERYEWVRRLAGGAFATLYLAPYNYHRIHMPLSGTLSAAWYLPGRLFSVNAATAAVVSGLYARNERVVCAFEHDRAPGSALAPLPFAMVLVGALFVGSITTVWHGEVTPRRPRRGLDLPSGGTSRPLGKGAEMGRFNMGSTVILLFPRGVLEWLPGLAPGSRIQVGQPLARLRPSP